MKKVEKILEINELVKAKLAAMKILQEEIEELRIKAASITHDKN